MHVLPASVEATLQDLGFSNTELLIIRHLSDGTPQTLRELASVTGKSTGVLDSAKIWNFRVAYAEAWAVYTGIDIPTGYTAKQYAMDLQAKDKAIVVAAAGKDPVFTSMGSVAQAGLIDSVGSALVQRAPKDLRYAPAWESAYQRFIKDPQSVTSEALAYYKQGSAITVNGVALRTDSVIGRMLAGVYQNAFSAPQEELFAKIAAMELSTGITGATILEALRTAPGDYKALFVAMQKAAANAGYSNIFSMNQSSAIPQTPEILSSWAQSSGGYVTIHFDITAPLLQMQYGTASIYLCDGSGKQLSNQPIKANIRGTHTVVMKEADIFAQLGMNNVSTSVSFRIAIYGQNVNMSNPPGYAGRQVTNSVTIGYLGSNSLSPLGSESWIEGVLTGTKYGVDWDNETIRNSCVAAARAFIAAHPEYYGEGIKLPLTGSNGGDFLGAARYMSSVETLDATGNVIVNSEVNVPGFTKHYLTQQDIQNGVLPPVGSVVVWDVNYSGSNIQGHIAIVLAVDNEKKTFIVIDTNAKADPVSGEKLSTIRVIKNFGNLIGWMTADTQQNK